MSKIIDRLNSIQKKSDIKKCDDKKKHLRNSQKTQPNKLTLLKQYKFIFGITCLLILGLLYNVSVAHSKRYIIKTPKVGANPNLKNGIFHDIKKATELTKRKNYAQALTLWEKLKKKSKTSSEILINLAFVQKQLKDYDKAYQNLKLALKLKPQDPAILNNLGMIAIETKKIERAINYFKNAVENSGQNPSLHFNLASAFEINGQVSKAIYHYQKFNQLSAQKSKMVLKTQKRIKKLELIAKTVKE